MSCSGYDFPKRHGNYCLLLLAPANEWRTSCKISNHTVLDEFFVATFGG